MNILLAGGHQKTKFLIKTLKAKGHAVTMVNEDESWCKAMAEAFNITCVKGDATKPYILADADAARMDTVAALSNKDSTNLVVCEIAKKQFQVSNTIAIVNDPKNLQVFRTLGVSKTISATQMVAEIIEQEAVIRDLKNFLPLDDGRLVFFEVQLSAGSPVVDKRLCEIILPENSLITCIIRNERTIIPKGSTKLKQDDRLALLASANAMVKATEMLAGRQK